MSVRVTSTYTFTAPDGREEALVVDVSTDASYSPDLASDLAARSRSSLIQAVAEAWPETPATP